jgi:hypothetical protein
MKRLKQAQNIVKSIQKKYLESSQQVYKELSFTRPSLKDSETEIYLSQSSYSVNKDLTEEDCHIPVYVSLNFVEITDLRNAFCEGFAGYSLEIQSKDYCLKTSPVDVEGNRATWEKSFKLYRINRLLHYSEKFVKVSLFEHSNFSGIKKISESSLDIFQYILNNSDPVLNVSQTTSNNFHITINEKYAIMDIIENFIDDAPKLGFFIDIKIQNIENFKNTLNCRIKYLAAQFANLKKEIERTHTKLVQHISAFSSVGFDESRIYVAGEKKNSFACFSNCSKGEKKKKNCMIY